MQLRADRIAPIVVLALAWLAAISPATAQSPTAEYQRSRPAPEAGPTEVKVRMLLVDLFEIIDSEQSFRADMGIIAEWKDPRLAGLSNDVQMADLNAVWNPRLRIANRRDVETSFPLLVEVHPDGTIVYRQRFSGLFSARLDLRTFPFDEQVFRIHVVAVGYTTDEVRMVPDTAASGRVAELSITDWEIHAPSTESLEFVNDAAGITLPGVAINLPATRRIGYYVVQVLLPLVAIIMMSWTVFWIDPSVIPTRVGTVVTTMLTLIAYRFALGTLVPKLPYLTRLDYFLLGATILVLLALFAVAATSFLVSRERMDLVRKIDRTGRIVCPAAFVVLLVWVWFG
jgi:hypothetical protein